MIVVITGNNCFKMRYNYNLTATEIIGFNLIEWKGGKRTMNGEDQKDIDYRNDLLRVRANRIDRGLPVTEIDHKLGMIGQPNERIISTIHERGTCDPPKPNRLLIGELIRRITKIFY